MPTRSPSGAQRRWTSTGRPRGNARLAAHGLGDTTTRGRIRDAGRQGPSPTNWLISRRVAQLRRPSDSFITRRSSPAVSKEALCAAMLNASAWRRSSSTKAWHAHRHDAPVHALPDGLDWTREPRRHFRRWRWQDVKADPACARPFYSSRTGRQQLADNHEGNVAPPHLLLWKRCCELDMAFSRRVQDRYETPFFDNLKKTRASRCVHVPCAPRSRAGKSDVQVDWSPDMGSFYGPKKKPVTRETQRHQGRPRQAARTPAISRTRGTAAHALRLRQVSCHQRHLDPSNNDGGASIARALTLWHCRRNCHKFEYYGMVLSGAQPIYVEASDDG